MHRNLFNSLLTKTILRNAASRIPVYKSLLKYHHLKLVTALLQILSLPELYRQVTMSMPSTEARGASHRADKWMTVPCRGIKICRELCGFRVFYELTIKLLIRDEQINFAKIDRTSQCSQVFLWINFKCPIHYLIDILVASTTRKPWEVDRASSTPKSTVCDFLITPFVSLNTANTTT